MTFSVARGLRVLPLMRVVFAEVRCRGVVTLDEAARLAMELPEVTEGERYGHRSWSVGKKVFAWERPFRKADLKRFGAEAPPDGPILAVRVEDLGEKEAVLAAGTRGFFTIPHFDGHPAVLVQLEAVAKRPLREALVDGGPPARLATSSRSTSPPAAVDDRSTR